MPLYEEKLISPLAIRFSQQRIRETFQDGREVEATIKAITVLPGTGDYDIILDAPFPAIEIIRWAPNGRKSSAAGENWFTFDNRRLYCLQRLAAEHWPKRVGAKVEVMYADAGTIRKKLDTKTDGLSVSIGHAHAPASELTEWSWRKNIKESACQWKPHTAAEAQVVADSSKTSIHDLMDVPPLPVLPEPSEKPKPESGTKTSDSESLSNLIGQLLHLRTTGHLPPQDHGSDVTTSTSCSEHVGSSECDWSTLEPPSASPSSASCKDDGLPVEDVDARPQHHTFSKGADVSKPKCREESSKERLIDSTPRQNRATRESRAAKHKMQMSQQQLALCQMAQAAQWQQMAYATQMAQWQQAYACQAAQIQAVQATLWQQSQSA
eukprot:TRINITY_DN44146_c0_g1_i1.p1 TRINITY_DN44146_c0_g1~~TRINITY_DN44146_c0_g1_i1.p1  ORF type:complete len:380 (-),score=77.90 TRINITY_DN44146_c0_g1_i1:292-1431(-)